MPCSDGLAYDRIVRFEDGAKIDRLTRLLCSLCRAVDSYNQDYELDARPLHAGRAPYIDMPNNVRKWWEPHKEEDKKREEANRIVAEKLKKKKKLRRSGLSKLTDQERTALGLEKRR